MFKSFSAAEMINGAKIKTDLAPAPPATVNKVGTEDGSIIITFKPTEMFPIYGGVLMFTVPNWFSNYFGEKFDDTSIPLNKQSTF